MFSLFDSPMVCYIVVILTSHHYAETNSHVFYRVCQLSHTLEDLYGECD